MRTYNLFAVFCLTIFICSASSATVEGQTPQTVTVDSKVTAGDKQNDERYRIGFQDTLEVTVYNQEKLKSVVNVAPDGTIRLPRIDESIIAVCKTERELQDEITHHYKSFLRNPSVNVRATEQRSQPFAVIGAVEKPGSFYLNRRIRLLELLSFAGGPDADKAGTKLIVARTGSTSACKDKTDSSSDKTEAELVLYNYKIKDVLEGKENLWMQPGDIVSVLDADVIYVYGNVNQQGSVKLNRPLTLRQAIVEAKGFKPATKKDKIKILRQENGSTEWKENLYDLKDIDNGKIQDPMLMPNDIVAVSEDATKNILNSLKTAITGGIPNLVYRIP